MVGSLVVTFPTWTPLVCHFLARRAFVMPQSGLSPAEAEGRDFPDAGGPGSSR